MPLGSCTMVTTASGTGYLPSLILPVMVDVVVCANAVSPKTENNTDNKIMAKWPLDTLEKRDICFINFIFSIEIRLLQNTEKQLAKLQKI